MNFTVRLFIFLWATYSFFIILPVVAQTTEETVVFADKQFELGNYRLALKEYKRVLFFNDGRNLDYIYNRIATIYFNQKNYPKAAYNYELAYKTALLDSMKNELIFKKAASYMLDNKFRFAVIELMNLPDSSDKQLNNRKNFYLAVCYWGLYEFDKAEKYFLALIPDTNYAAKNKMEDLFGKKKNLYRPNPRTAKTMSMILPGLGQMYCGDVKNGLNSMVLTGGLVILGIYMTEYYTFLDAFLTAVPWFFRYYKGGYQKAEQIALQKRNIRRNKTYQKILKLISD